MSRWRDSLRCCLLLLLTLLCLLATTPAHGYVDLAPTLARVISDSEKIALVEVTAYSREKHVLVLKEARALRGALDSEPIRHVVSPVEGAAVPRHILRWAVPGNQAVLFVSRNTALVCVGEGWYQASASGGGVWRLGMERPDLPLAYYGTVPRLAEAIQLMLTGKDAVLTTVPHGVEEGATIVLALNRPSFPGLVEVQRIRANLRMPSTVMAVSANPAYMIGMGPVDEDDLPALLQRTQSPDVAARVDGVDGLRCLGHKSDAVEAALAGLMKDPAPAVRLAAAAAILRLGQEKAAALEVLTRGMESNELAVRREAARYAGLAGACSARVPSRDAAMWRGLVAELAGLLKDTDDVVRANALQALAMLGPNASSAAAAVAPLLEDPAWAIDAADALGRMGSAARPLPPRLATMLSDSLPAVRWAAVRAMCQIGGDEARPALDFMIRALPNASEVDGYNMMVYVALLGPSAKDAVPAIQRTRIKNPVLPSATVWAIQSDKTLPWATGGRGGFGGGGPGGPGGPGGDVGRFIYTSYIRELGDTLRPAARLLAGKIMDGTAGDIPLWGYGLLACGPSDAIGVLSPGLADANQTVRERAAVALGYMGAAAVSAKEQVTTAIGKAATESEKRLLQWCLREITRE